LGRAAERRAAFHHNRVISGGRFAAARGNA
jgi:hypothetical protein